MPTLATSLCMASSMPSVSRSTSSLGKSPGQSFLSSVISSKPFFGLAGSFSGSSSGIGQSFHGGFSGSTTSKIISRKLWRPRSKSHGQKSQWAPQVGSFLSVLRVLLGFYQTVNKFEYFPILFIYCMDMFCIFEMCNALFLDNVVVIFKVFVIFTFHLRAKREF